MPTLAVGPGHGTLTLSTGVEGSASAWAHELTLCIMEWSCETVLDDGVPVSVELEGKLPSLNVVSGKGGLGPLTDRNRSRIKDNALRTLDARRSPTFRYASTSVEALPGGWTINGDLTLAGITKPIEVAVQVGTVGPTSTIRGSASLDQSAFDITPYTGMFGALRVKDRVDIDVTVVVLLSRDVVSTEVAEEIALAADVSAYPTG